MQMRSTDLSRRNGDVVVLAVLAALGAWSVAVPYLGPPLGLVLDVPTRLEVVDHVIPGLVVLAACVVLLPRAITGTPRNAVLAAGFAGLAFLAGLWMTSTHVPLLFEAADGVVPWGTALFHSTPGVLVMLLSLGLLVRDLKAVED